MNIKTIQFIHAVHLSSTVTNFYDTAKSGHGARLTQYGVCIPISATEDVVIPYSNIKQLTAVSAEAPYVERSGNSKGVSKKGSVE